jgi:hypothetical protein
VVNSEWVVSPFAIPTNYPPVARRFSFTIDYSLFNSLTQLFPLSSHLFPDILPGKIVLTRLKKYHFL